MKVQTNSYLKSKTIYPEAPVSTGAYGVEWDINDPSTACTRIGNMDAHRTLPIQSQYYGCVVNTETGQEVYKLSPSDWNYKEDGTPSVLDGTDGSIMVHIPHFYGRMEEDGTLQRVWIALEKDDFHDWVEIPELYVSAWEVSLNSTTQKLSCVVNSSQEWKGGALRSSDTKYETDNIYQSPINKPITYKNLNEFRTLAQNSGQEILNYTYYVWIFYWTYVIEYANKNCQVAFNPTLTIEGFHQGGLGNGVTTFGDQSWSNFNAYQPIVPNGYENSIGNGTGVMSIPAQTWNAVIIASKSINTGYNYYSSRATTVSAGENLRRITEIFDLATNSYFMLGVCTIAPSTVTYHIEGLQPGQEIRFYQSSYSSPIATVTSDGDITVNWTWNQNQNRYFGANFIGPCNITISIVSAEDASVEFSTSSISTCRWRGLSNPFGHIFRILEGVIYQAYEEDGEVIHKNVYTTTDPTKYGDKSQMDLISTNFYGAGEGYIRNIETNSKGLVVTTVGNGANSTRYFGDYSYTEYLTHSLGEYIVIAGGGSSDGSYAGLGCLSSRWSASYRNACGGARTIIRKTI